MKLIGMDLHIHSALSPCGGQEMTPPKIMEQARRVGLGALVIADHNSAENQEAFLECGKRMNMQILPGIEVQSREDVHILCIFDTLEQVLMCQQLVYNYLPEIQNNKEVFGHQEILDWQGNVIAENDRLLLTATNISLDDIVKYVHGIGGLAIPAHIDRPAFSLWMNLGFIPEELGLLGVELTPHLKRKKEQIQFIREKGLGVLLSSDAHWLNQISGPFMWGSIEKFTVNELKMALKGEQGRYLTYKEENNPYKIFEEEWD
ncbi:MAG: 3,5-nucleoside bisphosphate phosphatase [Clostridia bacterium]|jgi:hypothetical protein|nr:3,5-nucleoside bisphosphate phosphatase [Clostridia bacterium]MDN5323731.1 3,5-nucleoside bisphosphate phosphatase [Clostridia bacterium]